MSLACMVRDARFGALLTMSPQLRNRRCTRTMNTVSWLRGSAWSSGRMILWCTWLPGHEVGSDRWRLHILASIALPVGEVCNLKARLGSWRGFAPEWTAEEHEGLNE